MKKERHLEPLKLCGNSLPWVKTCKHLGFNLSNENVYKLRSKDTLIKRQNFISRNNEIIQEFQFAHPDVRFKMNIIYNSHFSGSPLWDLFSPEMETFFRSWNISVRRMYDLPQNTHTSLIEPISQYKHMKTILASRLISFVTSIEKSPKTCVRKLFKVVKYTCLSVIGRNLRKLMLLCDTSNVNMLSRDHVNQLRYRELSDVDERKVALIKELNYIKHGGSFIQGFDEEEINSIIHHLCTS